ncbi:hypothetical protein J8A97_23305, partial [Vibrio parahaemolyticus]|nr:hypothetical protein [Vibrio parahaemolyticus]
SISLLAASGSNKKRHTAIWYAFERVQHYVCYVTGYHFKAILSPSMYDASADIEQVFRPPFARSRPKANRST